VIAEESSFLLSHHKDAVSVVTLFSYILFFPTHPFCLNFCMKKCRAFENVVKGGKEINVCDLHLAAFKRGKKRENQEAFSVFSCDL